MDQTAFLILMSTRMKEKDGELYLREAFQQFDKVGNGLMKTTELREWLTTLGETLNDEEADELLRELDPEGSGQCNISG